MAKVVFKQPPLVEIIAELRWDISGAQPIPAQGPAPAIAVVPLPDGSSHEVQFMNFASKAGVKGFGLIERVSPPGFPLLQHQIAYRYRSATGGDGHALFQLGPGIFTINVVPPYKSWEHFLPFIELGIDLLLETWSEDQKPAFTNARLRYIDAFNDNLRQGKSTVKFLEDDLGLRLKLPDAMTKFCTDENAVKPNFNVTFPIQMGNLELAVADGWVRNTAALIMQTTVSADGPLEPSRDKLLQTFNNAHDVIHETFVGMTAALHGLMKPEEQV